MALGARGVYFQVEGGLSSLGDASTFLCMQIAVALL